MSDRELNRLVEHKICSEACVHYNECLSPCDKAYDELLVGCFAKNRFRGDLK